MIITQREFTFKERQIVNDKIVYFIMMSNNAKINTKKVNEKMFEKM